MRKYFDLTGRSALVTGAAGGIGAAVAAALADAGAAVLVTDLDKDAAAAVAERITDAGGRAESAALDVSDRESADAAAAQAAAMADGALHIVINNAGVTKPAMFEKTSQDAFRLLFDIHVMGAFNVTQAALPYIPTDGTGRIVNVTSAAGLTGTLGQVNYSGGRAGDQKVGDVGAGDQQYQRHNHHQREQRIRKLLAQRRAAFGVAARPSTS